MKRFISILLVSVMLLSLMTACASDGDGKDKNTDNVVTTAPTGEATKPIKDYVEDELPELNFGGRTIVILSSESDGAADEITVEELASDVVNDSVYNRELYVEERLGVKIENFKVDPTSNGEAFENLVSIQLNSDDDSYQIIAYSTGPFTRFVFEKAFTDLKTVDHIDLSGPWYSQKFIDEATIDDSLFLVTGSLSLSLTRFMYVVYYNKAMAERYSAGTPELTDLYSIVDRGEWTIDKYRELGASIYDDANGNSQYDEEDVYGLSFTTGQVCDIAFSTFDINILSSTDDGWFELDVNVERMYNAYEKLYSLMYETPACVTGFDVPKLFSNGQLLFAVERLMNVESTAFRNMTDDYGVLPTPKLDTDQKNYYTYSYDTYTSFAIPGTNPDPDCAGAVLEALSSYAYRDTMPAYLDTALKGKYMSDARSRKMIDLAVDGLKLDTAWIYIETIGSNFPRAFSGELSGGNETFSSTYASKERQVKRNLIGYKNSYFQ